MHTQVVLFWDMLTGESKKINQLADVILGSDQEDTSYEDYNDKILLEGRLVKGDVIYDSPRFAVIRKKKTQ